MLGVTGGAEKKGVVVVHVVAHKLFDHSAILGKLVTRSRDFY